MSDTVFWFFLIWWWNVKQLCKLIPDCLIAVEFEYIAACVYFVDYFWQWVQKRNKEMSWNRHNALMNSGCGSWNLINEQAGILDRVQWSKASTGKIFLALNSNFFFYTPLYLVWKKDFWGITQLKDASWTVIWEELYCPVSQGHKHAIQPVSVLFPLVCCVICFSFVI